VTEATGGTPDPGEGGGGNPPNSEPNTPAPEGGGESVEGLRSALSTERAARKQADKKLREFETKIREFEDRDKSESERLAARAEEAERELSEFKARDMARNIATEAGVPDMWDMLHGDEERMTEQAKRLAERFKPAEEDGNTPTPDLGAGVRGGDRAPASGSKGFSATLRRGAGYRG